MKMKCRTYTHTLNSLTQEKMQSDFSLFATLFRNIAPVQFSRTIESFFSSSTASVFRSFIPDWRSFVMTFSYSSRWLQKCSHSMLLYRYWIRFLSYRLSTRIERADAHNDSNIIPRCMWLCDQSIPSLSYPASSFFLSFSIIIFIIIVISVIIL